jgi:hypothetical protein
MVFLSSDDEELARAWSEFSDPVAANEDGECWQYVGTEQRGVAWVHVFRHRGLLAADDRAYLSVPATAGWIPPLV